MTFDDIDPLTPCAAVFRGDICSMNAPISIDNVNRTLGQIELFNQDDVGFVKVFHSIRREGFGEAAADLRQRSSGTGGLGRCLHCGIILSKHESHGIAYGVAFIITG